MTNEARIALIDADILLYRCGFAADSQMRGRLMEETQAANPEWTEEQVKESALMQLDFNDYLHFALGNTRTTIETIIEGKESYRTFLTGQGNFREGIATLLPYKGNRDPTHKPKYYAEIKKYLIERWNAEVIEGMEADDALGIAQWAARDKSTVICSIDKDLNMIPGWHYNIRTKEQYFVSLDEANKMFFWQMLVGDGTDNIPGIKGMGKVRSSKLLDPLTGDMAAMKEAVWNYYVRDYGNEKAGMAWNECARLLWMAREGVDDCPHLV